MLDTSEEYIMTLPIYQELYGNFVNQFSLKKAFNYPVLSKKHLADSYPQGWQTAMLKKALEQKQIIFTTTSGTAATKIHLLGSLRYHIHEINSVAKKLPHINSPSTYRRGLLTTVHCSSVGCLGQ